ncbi:hypothetical protein ABPG74_000907 [Tetrahymena malaccensis]
MLNISIFDVTYSNYGKYLESNVFMQKQKQKQRKQRENGELVDNQYYAKNKHAASAKSNNFLSTSVPGSTLNSKTVSFANNQQTKKNPFFSSQKNQNTTLNVSFGGSVGVKDNKNILNQTYMSSQGFQCDRPRTTSLGTAVFRSVERSKTPGFYHYFHRENLSEIKYQPKYDLISEKAPAFSISKAAYERMIDNLPQKTEQTSSDIVPICKKNLLLKDVQELESRVQQEQQKDHQEYQQKREKEIESKMLTDQNSHSDIHNHLNQPSHNLQNSEVPKSSQMKKRPSKLHPNMFNLKEAEEKAPKFHLQPKSHYVQKVLRYKYNQQNYSSATEANSPSNQLHTNQSQLVKRSSISPTNTNQNFTAALPTQNNDSGIVSQQQQQLQRLSIQKRRSTYEPKQANNSNPPSINALNNLQKDSNQYGKITTASSNEKTLTQTKQTKIVAVTDGQTLAYAEMMNTKDSFYGQSKNKGFHVKLDKQTNRPSTVKRPISQDEIRFNNFQLLPVKQEKAHPFTSYTQRKVFEPKDNAPSYDIHKVNYDRLLTNDHHNKGNIQLGLKPVNNIPITKHEIENQNQYSNLKNNEVLNASVRLDYPMIERAYLKQSGVKRPYTVNFGKSSPRKRNLFPKPEGTFKDYSGGVQTEGMDLGPNFNSGRQSLNHTITFYQPGEMSSTNRNNNQNNNLSFNL